MAENQKPCEGCDSKTAQERIMGKVMIVYMDDQNAMYSSVACVLPEVPPEGIIIPIIDKRGWLFYPKDKPQPAIFEGYVTANDPWVLRPDWITCVMRSLEVTLDSTGLQIKGFCLNPFLDNRYPTHAACKECKVRKTPYVPSERPKLNRPLPPPLEIPTRRPLVPRRALPQQVPPTQ
jgi:hypothetical protein